MRVLWKLAAGCLLAPVLAIANVQFAFTTLNDRVPGDNWPPDTQADAINDNGVVLGSACCGLVGAVGWAEFLYTGMPYLQTNPAGINYLSPFTNFVNTGYELPSVNQAIVPTGINDSGVVIGYGFDPNYDLVGVVSTGYLQDGSVLVYPGLPVGNGYTYLVGINDSDQIIGTYTNYSTGASGAFLYQNGVFTNLSFDPLAINNNGQIVGNDNGDIVVDTGGVLKDLGVFPFTPSGVNDRLEIVGGDYLYQDGLFIKVQDPGIAGLSIAGINDSGTIVGAYSNSSGTYGFVATTPEPAYSVLLLIGLGLMAVTLKRPKRLTK